MNQHTSLRWGQARRVLHFARLLEWAKGEGQADHLGDEGFDLSAGGGLLPDRLLGSVWWIAGCPKSAPCAVRGGHHGRGFTNLTDGCLPEP